MTRLISLAIVVLLGLPVGAQSDAEGEMAIRKIVAEQVTAWNAGDGTAYAKRVSPDAAFTNLFGMVMYGAPAFAQRHNDILSTFYKGTTKVPVVRRIRFVTPDVAIVDIDNEVHGVKAMPAGLTVPPDGVIKTQLMEVFVRRADDGGSRPITTSTSSPRRVRSGATRSAREFTRHARGGEGLRPMLLRRVRRGISRRPSHLTPPVQPRDARPVCGTAMR